MSRWFRVYDDLVDDPKVQRLPDAMFKALMNLWCLASKNDGALPSVEEIAFRLRMKPEKVDVMLAGLRNAGLLDDEDGTVRPHNWNGRQFKSDASTPRVKRHRERQRNVSPTVTATPPEQKQITDTEAEQTARLRLDKIEVEIREAAGLENDPSPSLLDLSPMLTLLDKGYDFSRDILPSLRAAKAKGRKGSTWRYYVPAIEQAKSANDAIQPAPAVTMVAEPKTVWLREDDPQWPLVCNAVFAKTGKPVRAGGSRNQAGLGAYVPVEFVQSVAA